jgi:hypothetical protein
LAYQWLRNGVNILGATSNVLTLAGFQPSQAGTYSVIVRNTANSVNVQVATLTDIPVLNASTFSSNFVLNWAGTFILQSATNVSGPYADITLGYNPFTNPLSPGEPKRFFRLRSPTAVLSGSRSSNATFTISVAGAAGHNYQIQASTNLRDWTPLTLQLSPYLFPDTNSPALPNRFYRALLTE